MRENQTFEHSSHLLTLVGDESINPLIAQRNVVHIIDV